MARAAVIRVAPFLRRRRSGDRVPTVLTSGYTRRRPTFNRDVLRKAICRWCGTVFYHVPLGRPRLLCGPRCTLAERNRNAREERRRDREERAS